jgi:hypothetical protein
MKSKCRVAIATILFAGAAAIVSAQNQDNPTPPPAPETTPALPPAPSGQSFQMATTPASTPPPTLTASPIQTPLVAPTPAAETKSAKLAARKDSLGRRAGAAKKTEPAASTQAEAKDKDKAAAAVGATVLDTNPNPPGANPPGGSPPSAPADNTDTALKPSSIANTSEADSPGSPENGAKKGDIRERGMGVGSWALIGILALGALAAIAVAIGSNGRKEHLSILEHEPSSTGHP